MTVLMPRALLLKTQAIHSLRIKGYSNKEVSEKTGFNITDVKNFQKLNALKAEDKLAFALEKDLLKYA
jgi:hypothetical protein